MKKCVLIVTALLLCGAFIQCGPSDVSGWSEERAERWLARSAWGTGLEMLPDSSIDARTMAAQVMADPDAWAAAFKFLQQTDLLTIKEGVYSLTEEGVYATVTDYTTRDSARFEAHRAFIDIQYVPSGREGIDFSPLDEEVAAATEYDARRDILFFDCDEFIRLKADSTRFFVFFPTDAHRPCMSLGRKGPARKIVVKIPWKE